MTEPSTQPTLSPQFCFSTVALRDFLRISRASIDDSITQNLNALITPAQSGFDPTSTSQRAPRAVGRKINTASCQNFKDNVLFPSWQARSDVIRYCATVAASPDPDDPDAVQRQVEEEKNKTRVIDDRLDPYSSRFFPREARTERLAAILRQETGVENIIRARSWGLVGERCGYTTADWEVAFSEWQKSRGLL